MNKNLKGALIVLPILIGGYIIYRQLTKGGKKGSNVTPTPKSTTPKTTTNTSTSTTTSGGGVSPKPTTSTFPLKKGDRGTLVKSLQSLILKIDKTLLPKYGADGSFGNETESALNKLLGHGYVADQSEYDKLQQMYNARILVYAPKQTQQSQPISPFFSTSSIQNATTTNTKSLGSINLLDLAAF